MNIESFGTALTHPPTTWRLACSRLPSRDYYPFVGGLMVLSLVFCFGASSGSASSTGLTLLLMLAFVYYFTAATVACVMSVVHDLRG